MQALQSIYSIVQNFLLNQTPKIIWINSPLFANETTQYDAELLLVASTGLITGLLPLELIKEDGLFSGLLKDFF